MKFVSNCYMKTKIGQVLWQTLVVPSPQKAEAGDLVTILLWCVLKSDRVFHVLCSQMSLLFQNYSSI